MSFISDAQSAVAEMYHRDREQAFRNELAKFGAHALLAKTVARVATGVPAPTKKLLLLEDV